MTHEMELMPKKEDKSKSKIFTLKAESSDSDCDVPEDVLLLLQGSSSRNIRGRPETERTNMVLNTGQVLLIKKKVLLTSLHVLSVDLQSI